MKITPESVSAVKTTLKLGGPTGGILAPTGIVATPDSTKYFNDITTEKFKTAVEYYNQAKKYLTSLGVPDNSINDYMRSGGYEKRFTELMNAVDPYEQARDRQANKGKPGYDKNGYPLPQAQPQVAPKTTPAPASKPKTTQPTMKSVGGKLKSK